MCSTSTASPEIFHGTLVTGFARCIRARTSHPIRTNGSSYAIHREIFPFLRFPTQVNERLRGSAINTTKIDAVRQDMRAAPVGGTPLRLRAVCTVGITVSVQRVRHSTYFDLHSFIHSEQIFLVSRLHAHERDTFFLYRLALLST